MRSVLAPRHGSAADAGSNPGPRPLPLRAAAADPAVADPTTAPPPVTARRTRPSRRAALPDLGSPEKREVAGLMRVNHSGEVVRRRRSYHGPGRVRAQRENPEMLLRAAREEADHLAWCQDRRASSARAPVFSPLWYAGPRSRSARPPPRWAIASALGFVSETERQSKATSTAHLERLPPQDSAQPRDPSNRCAPTRSSMAPGTRCRRHGAAGSGTRELMRRTARVMTFTSYWV